MAAGGPSGAGGASPGRNAAAGEREPSRGFLIVCLVLATLFGFTSKHYGGPGGYWVRDHGAGILYEVFWILLVLAIRPRLSPARVAGAVLFATSMLEFLQLWHPPFLERIRATFLGQALIGSVFSWWDFPPYVIGCWLGALIGRAAVPRRKEEA
jgi:hypothetical protein